jgi:AcrR family transcriptional regulator
MRSAAVSQTRRRGSTGIRERQKSRTRERLRAAARELFEERGYDGVTVAEIATRGHVSVKTLFQHFGSKEELLMAELDVVHGELICALGRRDRSVTPLEAVAGWLLAGSSEPSDGVERFMQMVGSGPSVEPMRRRLHDEWENAVVRVLAEEANEVRPTPRTRLVAAQLASMIRVLGSPEVKDFIERYPPARRDEARRACTREAAALLGEGLDGRPAIHRLPSGTRPLGRVDTKLERRYTAHITDGFER